MTLAPQQVEFNDFSGGITDDYMPGPMNRYHRCDNLLITRNKKLETRPGSDIYNSTYYRVPSNTRIGALINFDNGEDLFYQSRRNLYYIDGSGWQTLTGPSGNPVLAAGGDTNYVSYAQWNHQLFITNDASGTKVTKVYKDDAGAYQVRTAGMPALAETQNWTDATELTNCINLANDLRTQMLAHFADYGERKTLASVTSGSPNVNISDTSGLSVGMTLFCSTSFFAAGTTISSIVGTTVTLSTNALATRSTIDGVFSSSALRPQHQGNDTASAALIAAPAASDLPTLLALVADLLEAYENHYLDAARVEENYHIHGANDSTANPVVTTIATKLESTVAPTTLVEAATRLNDLRKVYNAHDGDIDVHTFSNYLSTVTVGEHQVTQPRIQALTKGPSWVEDYSELYTLANTIKAKYNEHVGAYGYQPAGTPSITSGSATITGYTDTSGVEVNDYVYHSAFAKPTQVVSTTATSVTVNNNATANSTTAPFFSKGNTPHSLGPLTSHPVTAANATTLATLATLVYELRDKLTRHQEESAEYHFSTLSSDETTFLVDREFLWGGSYEGTGDYLNGLQSDQIAGIRAALIELKSVLNEHLSNTTRHYKWFNLTGPFVPIKLNTPDPNTGSYTYGFYYEYTYKVGSVEYVDRGPVTLLQLTDITQVELKDVEFANIPVLANGSGDNYDTSNVKVKIARTKNGGTTLYVAGEVTNGTTTFTDRVPDANLTEPIYTDGGVVDNDPPPECRYLHIVDGTAFYGYVKDTDGTVMPNRVRQSIEGDPDSAPADFYEDFDEEVTGISSTREIPLVFCTDSSYRIEGRFDLRGQGGMTKVRISDTIGCISAQSIVQTDLGVFFAGNEGFCWTDGYQVQQISDWDDTYALLTLTEAQRKRIQGCYNKYENRIYWATQYKSASTDNDSAYILHLHSPTIGPAMPFTSAGGTSYRPTCFAVFDKKLLRGDTAGYTLVHDDAYTNDKKIDTAVAPSSWVKETIRYEYTSCGHDFGTASLKKWVTRVSLRAKNSSNVSMQVNANNDDGRHVDSLTPVKFRGQVTWGDPDLVWGDPNLFWNYQGMIEDSRHFPAGSLRCTYKQIQIKNAFAAIENSDSKGLATVDHTAKTATLVDAATQDWNADIVDYYIAFEDDSYVEEYLITARNSNDQITFSDPDGTVTTTGNKKWVVRGYPKNEKLHLLNYTIHHAYLGTRSNQAFVQTTGENA